jgi:hypothetical protein
LTRADALLGGQKDPIVPLNEINPAVSLAISEVILKGAELRQDQRFSSAAEMQKALRRAFKQGKEDEVDLSTLEMTIKVGDAPASPQTNPSEMTTRAQVDSLPPDSRPKNIVSVPIEPSKQANVKTEVLSPQKETDGEIATRLSSQAAASASAPGTNPMPSPAVQVNIPKAAPQKKSSNTGLIIGGVIGFLLLAGIAGGGGWFYYSRHNAVVQSKADPTPVEPSPAPSPTVAVAVEPDRNSNSNTAVVESNTNTENSSQNTSITSVPGAVRPQSPPGAKNNPARTTQPPAAKATPKTKARDDRTVIIQ